MAELIVKRGRVISVAASVDAGTLSNNANIIEDADGLGYSVVTGSEKSVADSVDAGELSNAANVIEE
jgi:hypothetical protein